jgi:predicted hydrolase (HD superfamily)
LLSYDDALGFVRRTSKYAHVSLVSMMMRKLAERLGENGRERELVGLLHDLDYDETRNDRTKHGIVSAERLRSKLPEYCLHAIMAHDYRTGIQPKTGLDKALIAADSLAVLVDLTGVTAEELSVERLQSELGKHMAGYPWLRSNILKIEKVGLAQSELFLLCLDSLKKSQKD